VQEGDLYRILVDITKHEALVHDSGKLCYKCFGHLHYGALPFLKDMVQGLPDLRIGMISACKGFALGQCSKTAFPPNE